MRWLAAMLCLFFVGACWNGVAADTSTGTGGSVTTKCPQTACEDSCVTCAIDGPCAALYTACEADADCQAIDSCWPSCTAGDTTCQQTCLAANPNGAADYEAVNNCIYCQQCTIACVGQCMSGS